MEGVYSVLPAAEWSWYADPLLQPVGKERKQFTRAN